MIEYRCRTCRSTGGHSPGCPSLVDRPDDGGYDEYCESVAQAGRRMGTMGFDYDHEEMEREMRYKNLKIRDPEQLL